MTLPDLTNPATPSVQAALTRRCEVCRSKPGVPCFNVCTGQAMPDRLVHYARMEAA
jgi:hypothetical protein